MTKNIPTHSGIIDDHPAFQSRNKRGPWIFKLAESFQIQVPWTGISFQAAWLDIREDGLLTIPKDYVWDGCSIKWNLFDLLIIGTPDGIIDINTMQPKTYYCSLVHDVLYQYYGYHGIPRLEIDRWFHTMLRRAHFAPAGIYYRAVRLLGGKAANGRAMVRQDGTEYFRDWLQARE